MKLPGLFIDLFAGGGGASTGIEQAIRGGIDVAVNHNPAALAIHKANHPATEHHCTDIRQPFLPRTASRGRRVAGVWASPDCKDFSKAKGGPVKDRSIRTLADEIPHWIEETDPEVVYVENVEEFEDWGPLEEFEEGKWRVIIDRKGEDFQKWVRKCRRLGYLVDWRQLRACDYGAPTSRKRLYIVMKKKLPGVKTRIVWPKPSHASAADPRVVAGKLLPYRTAAECIDWSIRCPSIFERDRELADATKRRIAHGVMRYVVMSQRPFLVPLTHQGSIRVHDLEDPFRTITGAHRGEIAMSDVEVAPFVSYGQHGGRNRPANEPLHTATASKKDTNGIAEVVLAPHITKFRDGAVGSDMVNPMPTVTAFLSSFYGSDKKASGGDPELPLRTVRASGQHHAVVCAHMEQANTGMVGHEMRKPLSTIVGKGCTQRVVETTMIEEGDLPPDMMARAVRTAAFLVKYYGTDGENETAQIQPVDRPIDVITVKARFAVVTVTIDAKTYVIIDIGLRMLKPRELARAQGFPDSYVLDPVVRKFMRGKWVEKPLTIAEQISAIGNSVCPPVARALVEANQPELCAWQPEAEAA